MPIRRLEPLLIDRIAAGEVIERPAAAVKELVENALDAGARHVEVAIEAGGRRLIRVSDDGRGMDEADLRLSVERHATSKIPDGDLTAIATFGFRGEALPSIASVSRLEIRTRAAGAATGLKLVVEDGAKSAVTPCGQPCGTRVEARDLFAATPARLKFLKSDRAEAQAVADIVRRLALSHPETRFSFSTDIGSGFDWPAAAPGEGAQAERLRQALGDDFAANSLGLDASREGVSLMPAASVCRPSAGRTRFISSSSSMAARSATRRSRARCARPTWISCRPTATPGSRSSSPAIRARSTSTSIRPKPKCASAIRASCAGSWSAPSSSAWARLCTGPRPPAGRRPCSPCARPSRSGLLPLRCRPAAGTGAIRPPPRTLLPDFAESAQASFAAFAPAAPVAAAAPVERDLAAPLGAARAQVHRAYIIAETPDGLVIVDQHAAHERIVYETLKRQREGQGVERQALLSPLVVDLDPDAAALIEAHADELASLGLIVEAFGPGAIIVREAPAILAQGDLAALVRDLAADLESEDGALSLSRRLDERLSTFACHHSVRFGRALKPEEMNALLRTMEATPGAGQCNHGRPTYVELKLADIERLFGRR